MKMVVDQEWKKTLSHDSKDKSPRMRPNRDNSCNSLLSLIRAAGRKQDEDSSDQESKNSPL